jgi:predicted ABC-type ATPase
LKSYSLRKNALHLKDRSADERLAQIIADFLRKKLLAERKRFSFETVFSHESKLDIMRQAAEAGYKVYLYFVSTESPLINKFRVAARKAKGGHDVPPDKIESRYYRSLDLLYKACQLSYQVYFF